MLLTIVTAKAANMSSQCETHPCVSNLFDVPIFFLYTYALRLKKKINFKRKKKKEKKNQNKIIKFD